MKLLILAVSSFFSMTAVFAQHNDFRVANWGASIEDIRAMETGDFVGNVGMSELRYKDVLAGEPCEAYYIFNDNAALSGGLYVFTKQYANSQSYVKAYDKFQTMLAGKYGEPDGEVQTWYPSLQELDRESFGGEIALGKLSLSTAWVTKSGTVTLTLARGLDQQPSLRIRYSSAPAATVLSKGSRKSSIAKN